MVLTKDFQYTIKTRINQDPEFAQALLIGFEELAHQTSKPSKSLHRMLSAKGNPTMESLTSIYNVLRHTLNVTIETKVIKLS